MVTSVNIRLFYSIKWLRCKMVVITVRLAYIMNIPNGSKIIQLLFSKSCILVNLLKTEVLYIATREKIILKEYFLILNTVLYFLMLMNA